MNHVNRKHTKTPERTQGAPATTRNKRLPAQTRKVLGKHYANKYRVR